MAIIITIAISFNTLKHKRRKISHLEKWQVILPNNIHDKMAIVLVSRCVPQSYRSGNGNTESVY